MRIIFIVPSLKSGGLERVASMLSNEWSHQKGVDVVLITLDSKPPFYSLDSNVHLIQADVRIDTGYPIIKFLKKWVWLRKEVRRKEADVLLTFGERYNAFVIYALRHLNIPIFVGNRTSPETSLKGFRGKINPKAYRFAKAVFLQTHRSHEMLTFRYSGVNFEVIPNPIEATSATIDYSSKIILNVGSFTGKKNQIALVRIFADLVKVYPYWQLVFAGEGPKLAGVKQEVNNLGIGGSVQFVGLVKEMASFHEQGSIFAFTSLLEGFPNALAEAMRSGLSVIAMDCITGPSELIANGENGFLIEEGNNHEYKQYLGALMGDESLRRSMGQQAQSDTSNLDVSIIAPQYLSSFKRVLKEQIN